MNRLFALFLVAGTLVAQEIPPALAKTTSTFLMAISTGDAAKLATVSKFPIKSNEFKSIHTIYELKKAFPVIFTKARVTGLAGQAPILRSSGIYSISSNDQTDPIQFLFKKFGNEYKFYLIDNINE